MGVCAVDVPVLIFLILHSVSLFHDVLYFPSKEKINTWW